MKTLQIVVGALIGLGAAQLISAQPAPFDPKLPGAVAPMPAPAPRPPVPVAQAQPPGVLLSGILAFDADTKEFTVKPPEIEAKFTFHFTNVSPGEVIINHIQTSCGCTVAQMPAIPWKIAPGGTGEIPVTMNVQGKSGVVFKTVTVHTDKGPKPLMVKSTILAPDPQAMSANDRERNQLLAKTDRQAVFKGDCARCHVEPVIGKTGHDLYVTGCGVCHDAEHRATMVPDLHNLPHPTDADFWRLMVTLGKPNTLMPAFAQNQGGPLSDAQINSLVDYLVANFPSKGTNTATAAIIKPKS